MKLHKLGSLALSLIGMVAALGAVLAATTSATAALPPGGASVIAPSSPVRVLVDASATATLKELSTLGGQLLQDYGAFSLWIVPGGQAASLADQPGVSQPYDFDSIGLRDGAINTRAGQPDAPAGLREAAGQGPQFWLVQFAGPIKAEWLKQLEEAKLEVVIYMPNNAYVVWGVAPAEKLALLAASNPMIQWSGAYHPAYRLSPSLREVAIKPDAANLVDVTVQFYTTAATSDSLKNLLKLGGAVYRSPERILGFTNVSLQVPSSRLIEIVNWPDVFNVEAWVAPRKLDEAQDQILAGNVISAGGTVLPNSPGYINWLASLGFPAAQSSYPIVDIVDDGIDQGNAGSVLHPDFHEQGVLANPDRISYIGNCTADTTGNGVAGHGNLNAGIVGAYNNLAGFPYVDANGYRRGLGVSPYGRMAGTKIFRNSGSYDTSACGNTDAGVVAASYNAGAQLTSNSWGADVGGAYDTSAQAYDQLTRDAAGATPGNQEMLHVFAAGNAGFGGSYTVGSPATAKDVLSVGATENVRDEGVSDGCNVTAANNADDIAAFSSRGPASDGRYKPEIMAPGTHVQGPASKDPGYTGTGVCGAPAGPYYPAGQTLYTWSSGTSHSTPAIAGTASLVWNYYNRVLKPGFTPSPALLKALLLNSTRYLQGSGTGGTLPSSDQGWGDANLGLLFDGTPRVLVDQSRLFTGSGQEQFYRGSIMNPGKPFRVTLVWTDPPGSTTGNAYVNNLDLEVTAGGITYKGNAFSGAYSVSGGTADARNNVESVFLPAGVSGAYTVRVVAKNLAGDGVPGAGTATDQDFALVIYNISIGPAGTLTGQVRDANTAAPQANTLINVSSTPTQTYSLYSNASGNYSTWLPAATYTVTAAKYGYQLATLTGVSIVSGTTTTQNILLTPAATYVISGYVRDSATHDPLWATVGVVGTPFNPPVESVQTDQASGFYSMTLAGSQSYTLTASALLHTNRSQSISPRGSATVNFDLVATTSSGGIAGWVQNYDTRAPIAGATVVVETAGNPWTTTDANGYFQIFNLTPGVYTATAAADLYSPVTLANIQVRQSNVAVRTFRLPTAHLVYQPVELQQTVTLGQIVTQPAGLVISNTGLGGLIFRVSEPASRSDAFGYTWITSAEPGGPPYNWIDATDGSALGLGDDTAANIALPFSFSFYTSTATLLRVGNNGGVLVNATSGDVGYSNAALASAPDDFLAPFWDDIDSQSGDVYWKVAGAAPHRQLIVEWFNRPHYHNAGSATFEMVLYENGDILYQYQDVDFGDPTVNNGASATIGIRGASVANSLEYSYLQPGVSDRFAICFDNPDNVGACGGDGSDALPWLSESPISGTLAQSATQGIQIVWNAANSAITQPGRYVGSLSLHNNDPVAQHTVLPVVMTVQPAAFQGLLTGIVSTTGICDAQRAPIAGAQVELAGAGGFTQTLTTNAAGEYRSYVDAAQSPYTIRVTAPDHLVTSAGVPVVAGGTTTRDFTLRLQKPCLKVDPSSLQATVRFGDSASRPLFVTSTGALPLDFNLLEVSPAAPGGGPDAYGYTWIASTYHWIDATDGAALGLVDDGEAIVTSTFPLPFYDQAAMSLNIGNNGAVLYNTAPGDVGYNNTTMASAPDDFLAPFWDDIDAQSGDVYWKEIGAAPHRRLIVEWFNRSHYNNTGSATFEMVLYENGDILYQYQDVDFGDSAFDNGASATIGLRGIGSANSLEYSYGAPGVQANRAICFVKPGNPPCDASDAPWLNESITGTVGLIGTPPTGQGITVTFNASRVTWPGVYAARLAISHNSPQPVINIPVTLTVTSRFSLYFPLVRR
jgi:hypothetical protein